MKGGDILDNNALLEIRRLLNKKNIILCFTGPFSKGVVSDLTSAAKNFIKLDFETEVKNQNVFSVFIEQIQNMKNYCDTKKEDSFYYEICNSAIILIEKNQNNYCIRSGNLIESNDSYKLVEKLEKIIKSDKDQLKKMYKEQLKKPISDDAKGAGLGFIDMARKANQEIKYQLVNENFDKKYFTLEVIVEGRD